MQFAARRKGVASLKGCSVHYHETFGLTDSVDAKLILLPRSPIREYRGDLGDLVSSIREKGLIEPILVRPCPEGFEVVAGARRLEACKRLRWARIPCIVRNLSDKEAYEISLAENIQRKTMNAVEEALAFKGYVDQEGWGGETSLAKKIGKSQEYVSQRLSLLSLPNAVRRKIIRRQINPSVAVEIAKVSGHRAQIALSERAVEEQFTVAEIRETARVIKFNRPSQTVAEAGELNEVSLRPAFTEPDFSSFGRSHKDSAQITLEQLDGAVNILRLALARLSTLVESVPQDNDAWEILAEKRSQVHEMINSLVRAKIKMHRRLSGPPLVIRP